MTKSEKTEGSTILDPSENAHTPGRATGYGAVPSSDEKNNDEPTTNNKSRPWVLSLFSCCCFGNNDSNDNDYRERLNSEDGASPAGPKPGQGA
jgi:hypothetical protein